MARPLLNRSGPRILRSDPAHRHKGRGRPGSRRLRWPRRCRWTRCLRGADVAQRRNLARLSVDGPQPRLVENEHAIVVRIEGDAVDTPEARRRAHAIEVAGATELTGQDLQHARGTREPTGPSGATGRVRASDAADSRSWIDDANQGPAQAAGAVPRLVTAAPTGGASRATPSGGLPPSAAAGAPASIAAPRTPLPMAPATPVVTCPAAPSTPDDEPPNAPVAPAPAAPPGVLDSTPQPQMATTVPATRAMPAFVRLVAISTSPSRVVPAKGVRVARRSREDAGPAHPRSRDRDGAVRDLSSHRRRGRAGAASPRPYRCARDC